MNLEEEILKEHSKRQTVKIRKWIGKDKKRFRELMMLFLHGEPVVTQRSAWVVGYCADTHPELIGGWLPAIIKKMEEPGIHDAVKRNVVRILQYIEIPNPLLGKVVTICFRYLESVDAPIAVKANAMGVIAKIAKKEPDLIPEFKLVVEQMLPYTGAALQARGRRVLKEISRDNSHT
jgi:hypothetical protein